MGTPWSDLGEPRHALTTQWPSTQCEPIDGTGACGTELFGAVIHRAARLVSVIKEEDALTLDGDLGLVPVEIPFVEHRPPDVGRGVVIAVLLSRGVDQQVGHDQAR